ncbi:hypothetical protein C8R43DRAFT_1128565 [Mycena crocata]|nr:hypothetical protein C8R43DRAFT_1128565 [Mycena crocata]
MESLGPVEEALGVKYFSAVAFVILVYDHLLSIDSERRTIWANENAHWHSRLTFFINRYSTEAVIGYVVYGKQRTLEISDGHSWWLYPDSGDWDKFDSGHSGVSLRERVPGSLMSSYRSCRRFIWLFGMASVVFGAISHFVIILRIYALWDRRKKVAQILITVFVVCISTTTILGIFCAIQLQSRVFYVESLRTCAFGTKPVVLSVMLGVLSCFDLFIVVVTVCNALERPHLTNIEVVSALQIDGLKYFAAIFALRLADLIFSIYRSPAECFIAITLVWALCSIINSQLHMRLEQLALPYNRGPVVMWDDDDH